MFSKSLRPGCWLFAILAVFILSMFTYKYFTKEDDDSYDSIIVAKSEKYSLDPNLVKAIIWRESKFNQNAIGTKGEIGLMQLMKKSAVKDWELYYKRSLAGQGVLFNPALNIEIGCWYLERCRRHWREYAEPELLMLAEYNAGYSNVKKWLKNCNYRTGNLITRIKFKSTRQYIEKIFKKFKYYSKYQSLE